MNCRKNVKYLSTVEKADLVQAFLDLKDPAKAPSMVPAAQTAGALSRYDDYVWLHTQVGTGAHRRPGFLGWHRKFVDLIEKDLQNVSGKPHLALPYWDWADLVGSNPFTADFLGGDGDGADNRVTTGDFAHSAGNWDINIDTGNVPGKAYLQRRSPFGTATMPNLNDVRTLLNTVPQDMAPWNDSPGTDGFRNRLEGWFGAPPVRFHNAGHVYVGGSMLPSSSPNDPVFWLHHANVDRLWAIWQQKQPVTPTASYVPDSSEPAALTGHRLSDSMALFGTHFGTDYTIDSVLDHKAGGYMYDTDIPEVTLETPTVDFGNVPVGTTTYHAIRFRVETCRQVRFRIIAGPSGNFSQTPVATFTAEPAPGAPFTYGYVFVAYTAPNSVVPEPGSSVTIEAFFADAEGYYTPNPGDDYSLLTVTVDLFATLVSVQKTAVALVLDRSGSMSGTTTTGGTLVTKAQLLKDSVSVFSALMRPEDGIGVVSYDDLVDRLLNITEMGPYSPIAMGSGRESINTILAGSDLDPRGLTGIGAGILEGNSILADGQAAASALTPPDPYDVLAMVVMTDGNENQSPTIDNVAASISANTFAVGLGTAGNVSEVALEKICKNNNGELLITGDISAPVREFFLTKLFVQVLAGVTNQDIILDPPGNLILNAKHRIAFDITEADIDYDVVGLTRFPELIKFSLETPDGTLIHRHDALAEPNITYVEDSRTAFYRINLPALPANASGSHAGRWYVLLEFDQPRLKELLSKENRDVFEFLRSERRNLPYNLIVQTRSNLNMKASVQQSDHEPGATLYLYTTLTEYNQPVDHRAGVLAEMTRPDSSTITLSFAEYEPGRFKASTVANDIGVYTFRVRAAGRTLYGKPFTREKTLSATVYTGADSTPVFPGGSSFDYPEGAGELMCRLLECIMNEKLIEPQLEERLNSLGVNVDALRRCLKVYCETKRGHGSINREPGVPISIAENIRPADLSTLDLAILNQIVDLKGLVAKLTIDREVAEPELIAKRAEEQEFTRKTLADEYITPIPEEDFFTKPMAKDSKSSSDKNKTKM